MLNRPGKKFQQNKNKHAHISLRYDFYRFFFCFVSIFHASNLWLSLSLTNLFQFQSFFNISVIIIFVCFSTFSDHFFASLFFLCLSRLFSGLSLLTPSRLTKANSLKKNFVMVIFFQRHSVVVSRTNRIFSFF